LDGSARDEAEEDSQVQFLLVNISKFQLIPMKNGEERRRGLLFQMKEVDGQNLQLVTILCHMFTARKRPG
jgi:hypothetical protein